MKLWEDFEDAKAIFWMTLAVGLAVAIALVVAVAGIGLVVRFL